MKKTFKRFMAFAMVAAMMANPMSALAAGTTEKTTSPAVGSADASGNVEDFVDTTIFKVVLPTSAEGTFDFKMDPQGLIAKTSGDALQGATYEADATVLFNTASANASGDWKKKSNYIEVLNRGTVAVDVSVDATVTGLSTIKMASSDSFTSGDAAVPELYLAFTASGDASGDAKNSNVPILTTNAGTTTATIKAKLAAASGDLYEFTWTSGNGYSYDLASGNASGDATMFPDYSFALTGACNPYADWTDVKNVAPQVNVVWTLEDAEAVPAGPHAVMTSSGRITFSGITAETIINGPSIKVGATTKDNGYMGELTDDVEWNTANYNEETGGTAVLQLGSSYLEYYAGHTLTLTCTLKDGSTLNCSAALPAN